MRRPMLSTLLILLLALSLPIPRGAAAAGDETASPTPAANGRLDDMGRLVGGSWKIGPLTHVFEWGIGHHTLIARSYDAEGNYASEARWFWHPGEGVIKGYSIDAAGSGLAEMTTLIEGDTMSNALLMMGSDGSRANYVGEWVFVGEDRYDWTLYKKTDSGREKQFTATGLRSPAEAAGAEPSEP